MQARAGGGDPKQAYRAEIVEIEKGIKQEIKLGLTILSSADPKLELKQLAIKVYKERRKPK